MYIDTFVAGIKAGYTIDSARNVWGLAQILKSQSLAIFAT
jgi:hypothetical protein